MAGVFGLVERRVSGLLARLLAEESVVALHGPRSVGKSTVLRILAAAHGVEVIDLDDIEVREALTGNLGLVTGGPTPLCIDEYQRVPDVLDAIKARLNREGSRPGVAVITGSTRQDALPRTAQALTGRLHTVTIWPLSQGELAGSRENLLEALRADAGAVLAQHPTSTTTREEYVDRVCAGGLPLAVRCRGEMSAGVREESAGDGRVGGDAFEFPGVEQAADPFPRQAARSSGPLVGRAGWAG